MSRPLVGLSTRRWSVDRLGDLFPPSYAGAEVDVSIADYSRAVAGAGGLPVVLTRDADPAAVVQRLDGLVCTGGADIGEEPERDRWEQALLEAALGRNLPLLCICRGLQLLNVVHGGTLVEDLAAATGDDHPRWDRPRSLPAHTVRLEPGSVAASVYGEETSVNSLHHQAVDRPGEGLVVTGRSPDGTVEAVELPGRPVLAVQWHPEALLSDPAPAWLVAQALQPTR